ncbi:MAG: TIR domain-containing protein [Lachnospiraceae bacterium]|nr:TIR domain-containing protein [Lachnospiraceae bacterium]
MEKKFEYDAFISYRHCELDKFVAENLHKQLEAFRMPKNLARKRKGSKNRIERVFRDKEELPLTSNLNDPIMAALHSSEWLIVICSPRLRESLWCKKEIETFVNLYGRERVLAVLVEGEPEESFPDELLYKIEKREMPNGTIEEVKVPVEPLAADVRGKNKKEILNAIKSELLRLCAAMFGVSYDALRQRHREQKMRKIITLVSVVAAICFVFGIYSMVTALHIRSQNKEIEAQSAQILAQSEAIAERNAELAHMQAVSMAELAMQYLEKGERINAVATAKAALTESEGIPLPYTPEAHMALADCVRAYDVGMVHKAEYQIQTASRITSVTQSSDMDSIAIYEESGAITLFDLAKKEGIAVITPNVYDSREVGYTFLCEDRFAYIDIEKNVCIFSLEERKVIEQIPMEYASTLEADYYGNYLLVGQLDNTYVVLDSTTYEVLGTTPNYKAGYFMTGPFFSEDGIMALSCSKEAESMMDPQNYMLHFTDMNTMETISSYDIGIRDVKDMVIRDGVAYVTGTESEDIYAVNGAAYLMAVDVESGTKLWEVTQEDCLGITLMLPYMDGCEDLLFVTNKYISLVNMNTGEVSYFFAVDSWVQEVNVYAEINSFLVFCEDGSMIFIDAQAKSSTDISYRFECKTTLNDFINNSPHGIAVTEFNNNVVTIYTQKQGPGVVELDYVPERPDKEAFERENATKIAAEHKLDNADYALTAFYSDDERYCFVVYWDSSLVIYDTQKKEVVKTSEEMRPVKCYLGADKDGNHYLYSSFGVYILNQDLEPYLFIENGCGVDIENQKVYLNWFSNYYESPLYSVEELLEMAEEYNS